ncbi:MAG: hypothetical protein JNK58_03315 [Phycisphaerae bacterium]|nr:hypothetical protein [Phycisphaerae bacterium]
MPAGGDKRYAAAIARVLDPTLASRSGFGAFRHYEDLFRATAQLVWESGLLRSPLPWVGSPHSRFFEEWWYMLRRGASTRFLFRDILADPGAYEPRALWALFWALAQAEHDFLRLFAPFWSHEERLTGHLLSQVVMQLDNFGTSWRDLAGADDSEPLCRITYIDTATAGQEKYSGGDLGLVIHGRYSRHDEFFKAAVLQAKKADWSCTCRVDVSQAERLLMQAGLGFYLLYHPYNKTRWCPAPTVHSVQAIESEVKEAVKKQQSTIHQSMSGHGWDFAAFVTFGLADPASELGVLSTTPAEAASAAMNGGGARPSRALVITVGRGASAVDWTGPDGFGEWIRRAGQG